MTTETPKELVDRLYEPLLERITTIADESCGLGVSETPDESLTRIESQFFKYREAQQRHLRLIADLTKHAIPEEDAAELRKQIGALIAEVGTLRNEPLPEIVRDLRLALWDVCDVASAHGRVEHGSAAYSHARRVLGRRRHDEPHGRDVY